MSSLTDQLTCAKRELKLREKCYPTFVARRTMTAAQAKYELATMTAIIDTLQALLDAIPPDQPSLFAGSEEVPCI